MFKEVTREGVPQGVWEISFLIPDSLEHRLMIFQKACRLMVLPAKSQKERKNPFPQQAGRL